MTNPSALPAHVEQSLSAVGLCLQKGECTKPIVAAAVAALSTMPATTISQLARLIPNIANLHRRGREPSVFEALFRGRLSDKEQLMRLPELAYLFVFHGDGRIREAALNRMNGGLESPFLFAAVAFRLNDWAEPVRAAAFACARRCFPLTNPEVIAAAAEALLLRKASWQRWDEEKEVMEAAFGRPDVASALAARICGARTGPASRILRSVLKDDAMDRHLQTLAVDAVQPSVRALAVQTLARGRASWIVGTEWKWTDKSMGRRVRVPRNESRELSPVASAAGLIESAALDRSAVVRRAALRAVIAHRLESDQAREIAIRLQADKSRSVRERAQFILSQRNRT